MSKATNTPTTSRRGLLAGSGVGAILAGIGLAGAAAPVATKAEPAPHKWPDTLFPPGRHPRFDPHPDLELLTAIGEFEALEHQWADLMDEDHPSFIEDDAERALAEHPLTEAQRPWLEIICSLQAKTVHGIRARAHLLILEDQEMEPDEAAQDHPERRGRMLGALLRDLVGGPLT